jgi:hypothetical protein
MKKQKTIAYALGIIILGAMIGGIIGELFGLILPESVVREFFLRKFEFGLDKPFSFDLNVIAFSFSIMLRMNVVSLIGIGFGYYFLRYTR